MRSNPFQATKLGVFLGANIGNPLYSIYHLAAYSGLRQGEILALRVGRDIDIEHQVITVRETTGFRGTGTPKSRRSRRRVGIGPTAAAVLADAIKGIAAGDLAFPYDQHVVSKSMGQACSVASLPYRRFHDLRHTYATLLPHYGREPSRSIVHIRALGPRLHTTYLRPPSTGPGQSSC